MEILFRRTITFKMIEILFSKKKYLKNKFLPHKNFKKKISLFKKEKNIIENLSSDNLSKICDKISSNWNSEGSQVKKEIRDYNLNFLISWLKKSNIKKILEMNLNNYEIFNGSKINKEIIAYPKGLVVHWLAGNVPVLIIISLFQGILTKNKNIIKAPESMKKIIILLLNDISKMKFKISKKTFTGKQLLESVVVVYIQKNDIEGQRILSEFANVRVVWGGKSAVDSIINLPKKFDCDDIILGPRNSLSIVSNDYLKNINSAKDLAKKITRDVFSFNQLGCNSPHNLYLEKGSIISHKIFIKILVNFFEIESLRIKRDNNISNDIINIVNERILYSIDKNKDVYFSKKNNWNIFYDKKNMLASKPLYHNSLFIKSIKDINLIPDNFPENIQTVGVAITKKKFQKFSKLALEKKALRFVSIGSMTYYNHPWDGFLPMHRMVNWIRFPKW